MYVNQIKGFDVHVHTSSKNKYGKRSIEANQTNMKSGYNVKHYSRHVDPLFMDYHSTHSIAHNY